VSPVAIVTDSAADLDPTEAAALGVPVVLSGHTHGGQVNLPIFTKDFIRRHYGLDFVYGHLVQGDRHLIISAGLGTTHAPVRFMRPPEVVELTIGGARPQS